MTRDFISQRAAQIAPSGIRRFFDIIASLEGVISLGVGEPDYATPWRVREAAIYALERGQTTYTSNFGLLELREAVAADLFRRYGVAYDPLSELLITVGASEAVDLAVRATVDPGDEVLVPDPGYVAYAPCVVLAGGCVVPVPTSQATDFAVRASDLEERVTPRTKALLLGYPNNPTGAVMSEAALQQIADLAERHDLLVLSDEIYARIVYETEHICIAAVPGMRARTVLIGGFSKAYAMTGWRIGYVAAPKPLLDAMLKIHQYTMMCAPTMAQYAAVEALRNCETLVEEMVSDYGQRRRVMVKGFNEMGLRCLVPQGAFYAFPCISSTGLDSEAFAEKLLLDERVAVVPGRAFGECGEGHVRCCFATSLRDIEGALERMARFVGQCRAGDGLPTEAALRARGES